MYRRKKYLDKIYKSLKKEKLILLLWTRQVWKTTILETLKKELIWKVYFYSFEDDFFQQEFESKQNFIDYFSLKLWIDFYKKWFFLIDEFQYVNNWEKILKSIYDDKNIKLKLIVTGSWLWTYWEKNKWTLVWRWEEIFIYQFDFFEFLEFKWLNTEIISFSNIKDSTNSIIIPYFNEFINFWWYPAVVKTKTKDQKIIELEKIITRYIDRDISFFIEKNEIINFKIFFMYLHTQIWNLIKKEAISKYLWIKIKHIEKYLTLLEKTMFISRVYPFFRKKSKEYSCLPKFYFTDVWILNFLEKSFDFRENNWRVIENFVFNELEKNKYFNSDQIKIYKKITKSEIDFIYDWLKKMVPIEVKSWNKKNIPKIFSSFEKDYNKLTDLYIITTSNLSKKLDIDWKKVFFIPNYFIWKMIEKINL